MATKKQKAANQRNARKSTGPRTAAGREAVGWNAFKHGLTATSKVVPCAETYDYERFGRALYEHWKPEGGMERFAFERLLHTAWRLKRVTVIETSALEAGEREARLDPFCPPIDRSQFEREVPSLAFANRSDTLDNLARYERQLERSVQQAQQDLEQLQYARLFGVHSFCARNLRKLLTAVTMPLSEHRLQDSPGSPLALADRPILVVAPQHLPDACDASPEPDAGGQPSSQEPAFLQNKANFDQVPKHQEVGGDLGSWRS